MVGKVMSEMTYNMLSGMFLLFIIYLLKIWKKIIRNTRQIVDEWGSAPGGKAIVFDRSIDQGWNIANHIHSSAIV